MFRNTLKALLFTLLAFSGCSLVRDQAYNLGYKDRRVLDTMKKQPVYSLKPGGIFDQKDHERIFFDGDTLSMTYSRIVNGIESELAEYSVEIVEDTSALEGVYRIYGNGPLSGKYVGLHLLTNISGAFAKISFQDTSASALSTARAQEEWGWVTDPLAFRTFKSFPTDIPVVYLSDPNAKAPATGGTNANTKQGDLRFIKLAHPGLTHHTNAIVRINDKGTPDNKSDDIYTMEFNEVTPATAVVAATTNKMVAYEITSVRIIAPNTEVYGVKTVFVGPGFTSSPVGPTGSAPSISAEGFLAVEFSSDNDRGKIASRMAYDILEPNAMGAMQNLPFFRWESVTTADLPTRVIDRFNGDIIASVIPFTSDEITPGRKVDNMPMAYNWENTREFHFDVKNFSVRVLEVVNRVSNTTSYRFRMIDDTSADEGVIQLQGTIGNLVSQYFHFKHYYPVGVPTDHAYDPANSTFVPKPEDTRLLVKIGQGASEQAAKDSVNTTDSAAAAKIVYQSQTNAYKPQRLFVNMHKRGGTWVGVLDDGNYNTEAATNWIINSVARTVQIRISTNTAPRFSTYRFHTVLDVSDNRIVAVLSNIKNEATATDKRHGFLEPDMDIFPNTDNDAPVPALSPFHGKYVALDLGTGVDNTRAKVEYADTLSDVLKKLDNRTAWNLYESTAVPTPNRIIKSLAGSSPWIRLNADGYYSPNHTEKFNFNADDMAVTITWHRSASATTLDNNVVAAAKYTIPLPMAADTSLQEGVFNMRGGSEMAIRVANPVGGFYIVPEKAMWGAGNVQDETAGDGRYKYADSANLDGFFYSALMGTLADANKTRVGRGATRDLADTARQAITGWTWHTLADAPLSPAVILHLMRTTSSNANSPYITSTTSFTDTAGALATFLYKPYETFEYTFSNEPTLQVTVRRIQDTTTTTAVYTLIVVNNLNDYDTIVRLNGTVSLGNMAAGRFMRIRIPDTVKTGPGVPAADTVYATNAAIAVFASQADAEAYNAHIPQSPNIGDIANAADFSSKYSIRLKNTVSFPLNVLPNNKTYQHLIAHKVGSADRFDMYDLFNPKFIDSAYVQFENIDTAGSERIKIKDAGSLDYSTYSYEIMRNDTTAANTVIYLKLIGEGGLYHNKFAGFRFDSALPVDPAKMHAVIGESVFNTLTTKLIAQFTTENSGADGTANVGWRYRELGVLTNRNYDAFKALSKIHRDTAGVSPERVGAVARVDKNGVYRSQNTDLFKFEFPTITGGEHITNMQISITIKKPGTESFGRYYFSPLRVTPADPTNAASATTPPVRAGLIMYGYLISFNYGIDGSTALAPYNKHFVILRTDIVDPAAPGDAKVLDAIISTNAISLGSATATTINETAAPDAFAHYRFWWQNGTNVRGTSSVPALAFNFRNQIATDVNSRIVDYLAVNKWLILSNIPAGSFGAGTTRKAYTYDPDNYQVWSFDAANKQVIITNVANGGTPTVGTYDISMQESSSDFLGVFQLSAATGAPADRNNTEYHLRYVFAEVPGETVTAPAVESDAVVERRTRDARIIMAGTTVGTSTTPIPNSIAGVKTAHTTMAAEVPTFGEWNAANTDYALNNPDASGISEKAFRNFHRRDHAFYTYESGTAAVNPTNSANAVGSQWNKDNWLSYMPSIRIRTGATTDSKVTNMALARKGIGGDYKFTAPMKMMQMDAGRTVFQITGDPASVTSPAMSFSNLFMGVEYGSDLNDRSAKVVFSPTRAGALEALNLRTTYNYFDGEMATNSGTNEQVIQQAVVADRGSEWVQYSNTLNNLPTATPPGLPGVVDTYNPAMPLSENIGDSDPYSKVAFDITRTTNFQIDSANKVVREMRIIGAVTNVYVYGYTVIESSMVPSLTTTPTLRDDNLRYTFVLRLEGFGDYKNYFMAAEIGKYGVDLERYKGRIMFGTDVAKAKNGLKYLQGTLGGSYPTTGSWNFISKVILTKPSALLNNSSTVSGYPVAPAARMQGISQRTGDPALLDAVPNPNFYSRLVTVTGEQSNVLDVGNHTNFAFWYTNNEPFVFVTSIQSNVSAQVRYKVAVVENYMNTTAPAIRQSNDVIIQLDNLGSPLHGKLIGIRRHTRANPTTAYNDVRGDYFSMQIETLANRARLDTAMGAPAGAATTTILPITLRFSNDIVREATGDNASPLSPDAFISVLTDANTGSFVSLDSDGIYMSLSNAQWNYNDATKLMTISYSSSSSTYDDPVSGTAKAANSAESYRVIPVFTKTSEITANKGRGIGIVLFRSDDTAGAAPGFLHNKYVGINYHGTAAATAASGAYLVYSTNTSGFSNTLNLLNTSTASGAAQYTTLTPYAGIDLTPLTEMDAIRNPDNPTTLPGVWALLMTNASTLTYQFDPSNTTLFKVDIAKKEMLEERVFTSYNSSGAYTTAVGRTAVKYRIQLVRVHPAAPSLGNSNSIEQITFKLVKGQAIPTGTTAVSGEPMTAVATGTDDQYMIVRTKKLKTALTVTPVWEDISVETMYLGISPTLATAQLMVNGNDANTRPDPYGVAAYVTTVSREALRYWGKYLVNDDFWQPTDVQNRYFTNTQDPDQPIDPTKRLAIVFDANTGRNGSGYGNGGTLNGVVHMNMGFAPSDIASKRFNFWQRLIRQIDENTFIFQLYGGQRHANSAFTAYTENGISYTSAKLQSAVSNKYWIVRIGQGTELFRSRITNGYTAAEALENLGKITEANYGVNRGTSPNWEAYHALPKGVDFIGNADVNPVITAAVDNPNTMTDAEKNALYSNRVPVQLEVDNYTNWNFNSDTNNPAVTISIRSNVAGVVGEQTITYGMTHLYNAIDAEGRKSDMASSGADGIAERKFNSMYGLTGFGPFAGRIISIRSATGTKAATKLRIAMAPSSLTRAVTAMDLGTGAFTEQTNFAFVRNSMLGNQADQRLYTPKAYKDSSGAIVFNQPIGAWDSANSGYWNFVTKASLAVDAGILSKIDNANNRIVFKTGAFRAANTALVPQRIYDKDATTNYSVDLTTLPPTINIQPVGESASSYPMGGVTTVETLTAHSVTGDTANISTTAIIGAVRLGETSEYLGIKIMSTNAVEGSAGIKIIRLTDATPNALQNTHNTVKTDTAIPDHAYIKDVVTTSFVLQDLEAAGSIISLNHYRGYDQKNSVEWLFNNTASTVLVTRLKNGAIDQAVVYKTVLVKDFAKLSTSTPLNDSSDLYTAILLKPTASGADSLGYANKFLFLRRKANGTDAPLSKNDFKVTIGNATNAGLTGLNGNSPVFGVWTNVTKNLFTGGSINGTTYALPTPATPNPPNMAIPVTNFQLLATVFGGQWSKLWESTDTLNYLYRKTHTTEFLFDNDKKLAIQRIVIGGTTNAYLFSVWLTNENPVTTAPVTGSTYTAKDNLSAGDRGTFYLSAIGTMNSPGGVFKDLVFDANGNITGGATTSATGITSKYMSFKFGHNDHMTRASSPGSAAIDASLADVFPPDSTSARGVPYSKLYDTVFLSENTAVAEAVKARRTTEYKDPYYIPAQHANASEKLMVSAARQIQAQANGTPVTEDWKQDYTSQFYPKLSGPNSLITYDFSSGSGGTAGNTPGESYNINVNLNVFAEGGSTTIDAARTNTVIGLGIPSGAVPAASGGRIKMLIRTLEANADGTEGVVRLYYGRSGASYSIGGDFTADEWNRATNQNLAGGYQLSNRYLAVKIGTGPDMHTAKFVWGDTLEEAKANLQALTYYNMASFGIATRTSENTLAQMLRTDGSAFVGKFVYGSADNYTIYTANNDDKDARLLTVFKTSEKPTTITELRRNQYQYKEVFFETGHHNEQANGSYFDTYGGGENSDGTRAGVLLGFGPLGGRVIRFRGSTTTGTQAGFVLPSFVATLPNNGQFRHLRIARNTFELTNGWKTLAASAQTNATNVKGFNPVNAPPALPSQPHLRPARRGGA